LRGVCDNCPSVVVALRGVSAGRTVAVLGDLASSSSSSTLMVSTLELTVVISADAASPVLFLFFFLASAVWVAAIMAAARDADILSTIYRVRRGADVATFGGALLAAGA
jgi:hypothetical protein